MKLKIDIINAAYSKLRISGVTSSATAEEIILAFGELESMMAEIVDIGYNFDVGGNDINALSNIELKYHNAIVTNLAVRLAPDFGKAIDPVLQSQAIQAMRSLDSDVVGKRITETVYTSRTPKGRGNRKYGSRNNHLYFYGGVKSQQQANILIFINNTEEYTESFNAYLKENETVQEFKVESSETDIAEILSAQELNGVITYIVKTKKVGYAYIVITITTDQGRVKSERRLLEVQNNGI